MKKILLFLIVFSLISLELVYSQPTNMTFSTNTDLEQTNEDIEKAKKEDAEARSIADQQVDFIETFGNNINNSFFQVIDIIVKMRGFFIQTAFNLGRIVFIIAICLAGLNYALSGSGLKDNLIKIGKATVFFFIVMFVYPNIINWITNYTFNLAYGSVGSDVAEYFNEIQYEIVTDNRTFSIGTNIDRKTYTNNNLNYAAGLVSTNAIASSNAILLENYRREQRQNNATGGSTSSVVTTNRGILSNEVSVTNANANYVNFQGTRTISKGARDKKGLFGDLVNTTRAGKWGYQVLSPAALTKIIFMMAGQCFEYASQKKDDNQNFFYISFGDRLSQIVKGTIMAFFLIGTGIFAICEYLICFIEFMLITSVGIILFPFSIWEGSKFWAEKFIGAILGFTIKLLFVTIAIFLMCYGFINMFNFVEESNAKLGFKGSLGEIVFIIFTSFLFFFICKSAPGIAQGLLTGTPSLSATGAISAAAGAVGGALAVGHMAKSMGGKALTGIQNQGAAIVGGLATAVTAGSNAKASGGSALGGFIGSLTKQAGGNLTRSLLGKQNLDHSGSLKSNTGLLDSIKHNNQIGGNSSHSKTPADKPNITPVQSS